MTSVRLATTADLPAILAISNEAALNTVANFAIDPEPLADWEMSYRNTSNTHPWLVAVTDEQVVGFAKASPWSGRCAYDYSVEVTVYVDPRHHRRGVGGALYSRLFEILTRQGYNAALGGITLPNEASVRLHEAFGMQHVATFERVGWKFNQWHDVGYWQKHLQEDPTASPQLRLVADVV
jgi:phosphinothricin acetyltransferase